MVFMVVSNAIVMQVINMQYLVISKIFVYVELHPYFRSLYPVYKRENELEKNVEQPDRYRRVIHPNFFTLTTGFTRIN